MTTYTVGNGKTYASIALALAAIPATLTAPCIVELWPLAGPTNEYVHSTHISVSGFATSGTNTLTIQPANAAATGGTGLEWFSAASPVTRYDVTKGIAIQNQESYHAAFVIGQANTFLRNLQIKCNQGTCYMCVDMGGTASTVDNCIVSGSNENSCLIKNLGAVGGQITNNIGISPNGISGVNVHYFTSGNVIGNTLIVPTDAAGYGTGTAIANSPSYSGTIKDNLILGYGTVFEANTTFTGDYNASDKAITPGTHNAASLTLANEITNGATATLDVRPKTGNHLVAGITDASIPTDALKVSRAGTPTMGAIEYSSGGGGSFNPGWTFGATKTIGGVF